MISEKSLVERERRVHFWFLIAYLDDCDLGDQGKEAPEMPPISFMKAFW